MRIALFSLLTVVVVYILAMVLLFFWRVSESKKLLLQSHAFERRNGGQPRILVVGDSTGVGTGVSDPNGSVAGRLGADFPTADIQNLSVNGWKVADALTGFPPEPNQSFDLVLLQIGANDIIRGTNMSDFTRDLALVFDRAKAAGKNVVALHSGNIGQAPLFPWPVNWYMTWKTRRYRNEYMRIAEEKGVVYVNLFHENRDDPFKRSAEFYAPDFLHLREAGYGVWYTDVRATMMNAGIHL